MELFSKSAWEVNVTDDVYADVTSSLFELCLFPLLPLAEDATMSVSHKGDEIFFSAENCEISDEFVAAWSVLLRIVLF